MADSLFQQHRNKVIAVVTAAATALIGFTTHWEGNVYKAYQDPKGIWTICRGHTKGVYKGMTATKEECNKFFKEDMEPVLFQIIVDSPKIIENKNALYAAGDYAFNSGIGAYKRSPMAMNFRIGNWENGCNSFSNYYDGIWSTGIVHSNCRFDKNKNKYYCKLPGLTRRREAEKNLCLGNISIEDFSTGD